MNKKIVVFDDDEDILIICTYLLEDEGWEVTTFNNCNNIIDQIEPIMPDVIFMDNWIPDFGGIVATQLLKKHEILKTIPVIYFSANNGIKELAEKAGADAYLPKPFDLKDIGKIISKVLNK